MSSFEKQAGGEFEKRTQNGEILGSLRTKMNRLADLIEYGPYEGFEYEFVCGGMQYRRWDIVMPEEASIIGFCTAATHRNTFCFYVLEEPDLDKDNMSHFPYKRLVNNYFIEYDGDIVAQAKYHLTEMDRTDDDRISTVQLFRHERPEPLPDITPDIQEYLARSVDAIWTDELLDSHRLNTFIGLMNRLEVFLDKHCD